jgi:hypothetical protein
VPADRSVNAYNVPLNPDGTFSGSIPYHDSDPTSGHEDGTFSYSGKFSGTDPVKGVFRLHFATPGDTCDTGSVRYEMRDPFAAPGSGKLKKKAVYYGVQSDGRQIALRVDKKAQKTRNLYFDAFFDKPQCTGRTPGLEKLGQSASIKIKKGKFKKSGTERDELEPGSPTYKWKLAGKFGKERVAGTLRYTADLEDEQGKVISHCTSPKLKVALERG